MKRDQGLTTADLVTTGLLITLFLAANYGTGYAIYALLGALAGHPLSLGLPIWARLLGAALLVTGLTVAADVFRFRRPWDVWVSTSVTFMKLLRMKSLDEKAGRTEPFIPKGPYVYVRSPMYFGVVTIAFGLGVAVASVPLLLWGFVLTCGYWFFLIPFEERELLDLFGASYADYRRQVPKLFPYGRRYSRKE